ncbi:methyltransferase domain-containing protein [Streptomyces sp. SID10853]|uniref:methyltransferase domain-containing protein n=1 Tax=Streptomyces sp. SID10853 TaxID=2706028 RepID=UPI0013C05F3B|nr:methyltransferase domain-containing protein [Streptomyces sp. SID10853]NDZ82611.1 methyltransferase domain-containing protein [Streptomyces sp. SID10853]
MGADQALRAALVREIAESGALPDPAWRDAFAAVPRHLFVPYFFVDGEEGVGRRERLWGEDPDPERRRRWLEGVYTDQPLATRIRDGELISSSSQPSLMARMLDGLAVRDGDTVLEIGAGSGYNAALLAHRLDDSLVTTVDIDPEITESARTHLSAVGAAPAVVTGDGALGCPARAPFDAIIVTCAVPSVPRAWLAQSRPGARILAPLATGLIVLRVRDERHAQGRFLETPAYFVPLRGTAGSEQALRGGGLPPSVLNDALFRFVLTLTAGSLDPVEAFSLWEREGRPQRERFGVTVSGEHEWAWLDDPEGPYTWPLVPPAHRPVATAPGGS